MSTPDDIAPDEPGDADGLPHIPTSEPPADHADGDDQVHGDER